MRRRRRTVARLRRDSAGIRDDAVVLRSSDVAGMRRWTRLRRQQVVLSEKAVQRGAVDPKGAGTYRGSGSNRSSAAPAPLRNKSLDRKSTRLNSSHSQISYAVFCLKKKTKNNDVGYIHPSCLLRINPFDHLSALPKIRPERHVRARLAALRLVEPDQECSRSTADAL